MKYLQGILREMVYEGKNTRFRVESFNRKWEVFERVFLGKIPESFIDRDVLFQTYIAKTYLGLVYYLHQDLSVAELKNHSRVKSEKLFFRKPKENSLLMA